MGKPVIEIWLVAIRLYNKVRFPKLKDVVRNSTLKKMSPVTFGVLSLNTGMCESSNICEGKSQRMI